uniref:Peptidase C1A papain C-terminal domain-containing protein n=1 Tax=Ditylenchus dipsaci TaxID=166011 RepID=A0A915E259_9BILA
MLNLEMLHVFTLLCLTLLVYKINSEEQCLETNYHYGYKEYQCSWLKKNYIKPIILYQKQYHNNFRYAHRKGGGKAAIPTVVHYLRPFTGFWQETCLPFHDDGILFKIGIARSSTIGHFLQLLKKRPVAVTISVTRRFRDYTTTAWSEFYKVSARDRDLIIGNHALVLLCYRSDPEGNVDVLAQSSWGPDYGILGYVWIRLDSNAEKYMSLTSDVVYITDVERDN